MEKPDDFLDSDISSNDTSSLTGYDDSGSSDADDHINREDYDGCYEYANGERGVNISAQQISPSRNIEDALASVESLAALSRNRDVIVPNIPKMQLRAQMVQLIQAPVDPAWLSTQPDLDWAVFQLEDKRRHLPNAHFTATTARLPISANPITHPTQSPHVYIVRVLGNAQPALLDPVVSSLSGMRGSPSCEVWKATMISSIGRSQLSFLEDQPAVENSSIDCCLQIYREETQVH